MSHWPIKVSLFINYFVFAILLNSVGNVVQLSIDNITDEDPFTESDPRTLTAPNGRFIMPRTVKFSVGYEF